MAKQQKPKPLSEKQTQRHHNRATKGLNTRKKKVFFDPDELELDWVEELTYLINTENYKVYKEDLSNDHYEYRIRDDYGNLIISVISRRNLNRSAFGFKRRRRRRRRQ